MKIRLLTGIGIFLVLLSSCRKNEVSDLKNVENQRISVITEKVIRRDLRSYIELNGGIEADNSVKVYPLIAGKITGNFVELGAQVKKGDTLLCVDPSTPGNVYTLSKITAPISGSVVSLPLRAGTSVTPETEVITIGDLSKLQVRSYVPEKYFSLLKAGLQADIGLESYPDTVFKAHIERVSPVVDEASRTVEIIISFEERDKRITAGMYSKIKLYLEEFYQVIAVAEKAIVLRSDCKTVFTVKDGKTVANKVSTGICTDGMVQILNGLNEGDFIVTDGLDSLNDGSLVIPLTR